MRLFGRDALTDAERERLDREDAQLRRRRDEAGIARQRANDAEAERRREWQRIQDEGHAQQEFPAGTNSRWSPSGRAPADQDTREQRAERQRALGQLQQTEKERLREWQAWRTGVGLEANALRSAMDSAVSQLDKEAYVAAHGRFEALASFCDAADAVERTRRELASRPNIPHAVP